MRAVVGCARQGNTVVACVEVTARLQAAERDEQLGLDGTELRRRAAQMLAGSEKVGKSLLCCELVARASHGQLDGDWFGRPVRCLYLTAEDRISHVVAPRMRLAGVDPSLVLVGHRTVARPSRLARIAAAIRSGVRLIVLDPLVLFLDGLDDENTDLKVRQALDPVVRLLRSTPPPSSASSTPTRPRGGRS